MPTVDFTLQDVKQLIEQSLLAERLHTRTVVKEIVPKAIEEKVPAMVNRAIEQKVPAIVAGQFISFWETTLDPVLQEMQEDITVIKDTVKDHSFRIARLESRLKRS